MLGICIGGEDRCLFGRRDILFGKFERSFSQLYAVCIINEFGEDQKSIIIE